MKNINGTIFGDDPSQGMVIDGEFIHPGLNFSIKIPDNFAIENSSKSLVALKESIGLIKIDISKKGEFHSDPVTYLKNIWKDTSNLKFIEEIDINTFQAATGLVFTKGRINKYSGKIQIRYIAVRLDESKYLRFVFVSRSNNEIFSDADFKSMVFTLRNLNSYDLKKVKPLRVFYFKVQSDVAVDKFISKEMQGLYKRERFKLLNKLDNNILKEGTYLKLLKYKELE